MLKRSLIIFLFIFLISFVSAGVTVSPPKVEIDTYVTITIDLSSYGRYVYFYEQGSENVFHTIDLGCGETCSGRRTFDYLIDSSIFNLGIYKIAVDSHDDTMWLFYEFEVIVTKCEDGTLVGQCSVTQPKYCNEIGNLIDICLVCGCPIGYGCQEGGSCVSSTMLKTVSIHLYGDYDEDTEYCSISMEDISLGDSCGVGESCSKCAWNNVKTLYDVDVSNYCEDGMLEFIFADSPDVDSSGDEVYCNVGHSIRVDGGMLGVSWGTSWCSKFPHVGYENRVIFNCTDWNQISVCLDDTIAGQCSITKPKYCDNSGKLIDNCMECGCPSDHSCQEDGSCTFVHPIAPNTKLTSLYSDKEVFLVSDKDWKNILPFVSVVVWTQGSAINKYPFLVYYEKGKIFDVGSMIHFIQQYSPDKVTIIGQTLGGLDNFLIASPDLGAGLSLEQIQRIYTDDYLSYWESFDTVVYVKDNYELALLASTYASLINAPLIIQGTTHDSADIFTGRNVICVGSVSPAGASCSETYNLEGLQQKYKTETNTDKIILVNPDDWEGEIDGVDSTIYEKGSLISPILASAKHELIISATKTNSEEIDNYLEQKISELFNDDVKYLTIMAPSEFIPHSKKREGFFLYDWRISLDASSYADLTGDNKPDISVGRISGGMVTDVSSYTARALFYDTFTKTNNMKFMASSFGGVLKEMVDRISTYFSDAGYNSISVTTAESCYDFNPDEWKNQDLIYYADHGSYYWAGIKSNDIPKLSNSLVVIAACSTVERLGSDSFGVRALTNGAIGYMGSVGTIFLSTEYTKYLNEVFYHEKTLGDAFKSIYEPTKFHAGAIFLGDPTLDINPKHLLKKEIPSVPIIKQCKVIGDWCCEWDVCKSCCSPLQCKGVSPFKECKDPRCQGTDRSCGYSEAKGTCVNCETIPPDSLVCNLFGTKVKGYYFKCDDSQLCVTKTFRSVIEECSNGCSSKWGAHCRTCKNTDASCGAYENCEDCTAIPPINLACRWGNVYGHYSKCNDDDCVKKFWRQKVKDCSHYCKDGVCKCYSKNTKVNFLNQHKCCNGWKWIQKSVANFCCWGKWWQVWKCWWNSAKCGTHLVNDYKVCK